MSPVCLRFLLIIFLLTGSSLAAQDKKVLTVDDYERWNTISSVVLSPNGEWMSYGYSPLDGDGKLFLRHLDGDTIHEIEVGSSPRFSHDGRWAAYLVSPGEEETEKLRKANKPIVRTLELIELATGEKTSFKNASSANFSKTSSHLAIRVANGGSGSSHKGSDLLLVSLSDATVRNIGNVHQFAFNDSGKLLAFTVDAAEQHGNGLYLADPSAQSIRQLDSDSAEYTQLTWDEDGHRIAVLKGKDAEDKERKVNHLVTIANAGQGGETKSIYGPDTDQSFPEGLVISELGRLSFSEDGTMVMLGLKYQVDKPEKNQKDDERPNVDVWHWNDDRVQSVQIRRAERDKRATMSAVVHLDGGRLVQLSNDTRKRVNIVGKGAWGICVDDEKYRREITWGGRRADYFRVDLNTGEQQPITQALGRPMGFSPDGNWFVFLKGGEVWSHHMATGKTSNLSKNTPVNFVNVDDDHPFELPAYGVAGWSADGKSVVLNHKYDLWSVPLDGSPGRNLTGGVGTDQDIRFRYVNLDPEAETIDLGQPILLSAYGEWTKKSGYYLLKPDQTPQPLIFEDRSIGRPIKAENSDRVVMTMQTFEDYPNYWATNTSFESPKQITDANPQQDEYAWGKRVLIDYTNSDNVRLQATLTLPADYEPGKKYPMLVYFYEKMSQRHHSYSSPRFDDRPHMCTYASDGYLVLMPDVVYKTGRPGSSAVDCVTSAVQQVIDEGYADPDHVVLQGHSWGGYQSSYILTQTDMFAAVVTGAPVTNLVSFYGELYKSSGTVQQGITEKGQVRMGTTPWENMELYHSQSPLHNVQNISTPFIILHGTDDGAVDWHQGLEYYNAARRNGKEVILLSYPGEGHHLTNRANQIDFQIRMKQFFDHYAKGTEAPSWMVDGVPHLEKDKASPRPPVEEPESNEDE